MICPKCGKEMKIKRVFGGEDKNGNPIYKKYACCPHCRIRKPLDGTGGKNGTKHTAKMTEKQRRAKQKRRKKRKGPKILLLLLLLLTCVGGALYYVRDRLPFSTSMVQPTPKSPKVLSQKEGEFSEAEKETSALSKEQYDQIQYGMSRDDVAALLGSEGMPLSETTAESSSTAVFIWYGEEENTSIAVTFHDGKVQEKLQTGLEPVLP